MAGWRQKRACPWCKVGRAVGLGGCVGAGLGGFPVRVKIKASDDSKPTEELTVPLPVRTSRDTAHLEDIVHHSRGDTSQLLGSPYGFRARGPGCRVVWGGPGVGRGGVGLLGLQQSGESTFTGYRVL